MFSQSCGISPVCSDLIAVAVGAQSLPVCSLQGWWCCRSWAVIHFWEYFSGWDEHGQMWPFGCGAATWVQTRAALTKPGFGEEVMPMCTVHIYFGAKNCYKGMFGVGDVWNLCVFCGARHFGSKMLLFSPQTLRCTSPFCFSTVLKGDLILSSFEEGIFCCIQSLWPWHLLQLSTLAACRGGLCFTYGAGNWALAHSSLPC